MSAATTQLRAIRLPMTEARGKVLYTGGLAGSNSRGGYKPAAAATSPSRPGMLARGSSLAKPGREQ
jgi:hypothetical protein